MPWLRDAEAARHFAAPTGLTQEIPEGLGPWLARIPGFHSWG